MREGGREEGSEGAYLTNRALQWIRPLLPFWCFLERSRQAERGQVRAAAVELGVGGVDPEEEGGREGGREG